MERYIFKNSRRDFDVCGSPVRVKLVVKGRNLESYEIALKGLKKVIEKEICRIEYGEKSNGDV